MEVTANLYLNDWWPGKNTQYTAQILNEKITEKKIVKFNGPHKPNKTDLDVIGFRFDDCEMSFIPDGITAAYPNMKIFLVFNANITKLTKEDFQQFGNITEIWFSSCSIEYLPGNLFEYMPNLEIISFQSCKIKYIDADILDNYPKLKVCKLNSNENIDIFYDTVSGNTGGVTYSELKEELKKPEVTPPANYSTYYHLSKNISADIKAFLNSDQYKDFNIAIDGIDFKVHKFILAARSRVLADMIENNPDAETLTLVDIKKDVFTEILKYIYEDEMPKCKMNAFDVFSAACRLGLEKLKVHAIKNMGTDVTADNALDMLIYGKRYGNNQLQDNAIVEIKKMFPDKEFKEEVLDSTDRLKAILEAKKRMDEAIQKAKEEFESQNLFE